MLPKSEYLQVEIDTKIITSMGGFADTYWGKVGRHKVGRQKVCVKSFRTSVANMDRSLDWIKSVCGNVQAEWRA